MENIYTIYSDHIYPPHLLSDSPLFPHPSNSTSFFFSLFRKGANKY